jgi:O-acetylserine/cysteine efflux transporter
VVIGLHAQGGVTLLGLGLVSAAGFSWGCGNIIARRSAGMNMLGYVVWASLFSFPPLLALSLAFEGWRRIAESITHAGAAAWAAMLYQSLGNTLFGYAVWGSLLSRHPAASVSPFALLAPVIGMATAAWWLSEPLPAWKIAAAALVLGGLALNLLWPSLPRAGPPLNLR